jgi:hypothetical protein
MSIVKTELLCVQHFCFHLFIGEDRLIGIAPNLNNGNEGIKKDPNVYKRVDNIFIEIAGKVLGIDASILMSNVVKQKRISKKFFEKDYRPAQAKIKEYVTLLRSARIVPKFVFDGLNQGSKKCTCRRCCLNTHLPSCINVDSPQPQTLSHTHTRTLSLYKRATHINAHHQPVHTLLVA